MIYLTQYSGTTIALTLTEKQTLTNPNYYIEFVNCQTLNSTIIKIDDISVKKNRYNLFEINLTTDIDIGYYDYIVYETPSRTFNKDLILEVGKMLYQK